MPRRGIIGLAALTGVLLGAAFLFPSEPVLTGLCRWLDVGEAAACADHVLLLPGDDTYRPLTVAAVIKSGLAGNVLIPETAVPADVADGLRPATHELLVQVLQHRGILRENIVCLTGASRTTFDDAHALSAYLENRPDDRVIVVTNAFHTRRARFIFRRVLGDQAQRLQFVAAPNPGFAEQTWWQNRSSANIVLAENLKLVFYVFRYSGLYGWAATLLVITVVWRWWRIRSVRTPRPPANVRSAVPSREESTHGVG
ncbi:MAG: YdcF family protein [Planctomycetaceae bacterium]|nr:YdcF family protein [Planctomycetaceae bacterium]